MYQYKYKYLYKYGCHHDSSIPQKGHISQRQIQPEGVTPSVEDPSVDATKPIYFYEHTGERGDYFIIYPGQGSRNVGNFWNDKISSILMPPLSRLKLYVNDQYVSTIDDDAFPRDRWEAEERQFFINPSDTLWRMVDLTESGGNDEITSVQALHWASTSCIPKSPHRSKWMCGDQYNRVRPSTIHMQKEQMRLNQGETLYVTLKNVVGSGVVARFWVYFNSGGKSQYAVSHQTPLGQSHTIDLPADASNVRIKVQSLHAPRVYMDSQCGEIRVETLPACYEVTGGLGSEKCSPTGCP